MENLLICIRDRRFKLNTSNVMNKNIARIYNIIVNINSHSCISHTIYKSAAVRISTKCNKVAAKDTFVYVCRNYYSYNSSWSSCDSKTILWNSSESTMHLAVSSRFAADCFTSSELFIIRSPPIDCWIFSHSVFWLRENVNIFAYNMCLEISFSEE